MRADGPPCRICDLLDQWKDWLFDRLRPPTKEKVEDVRLEPVPQQISKPILQLPTYDPKHPEELRILDVCKLLDITLDSEGRGTCPLCNHGSPTAFVVTERLGRFWCHGHCQNGGDALELVAQLRQTSKPEASRWLLEQLGPP
jgi:hypothetical protein